MKKSKTYTTTALLLALSTTAFYSVHVLASYVEQPSGYHSTMNEDYGEVVEDGINDGSNYASKEVVLTPGEETTNREKDGNLETTTRQVDEQTGEETTTRQADGKSETTTRQVDEQTGQVTITRQADGKTATTTKQK